MEHISRRHALRLAGVGLVAGSAAAAAGSLSPGSARALGPARPGTSLRRAMKTGAPLIGMSAPAKLWAQRVREVGDGLTARRIFADLVNGPTSQIRAIEQAHADGLLPVVSYKVGGDVAGAVAGEFNAVARRTAERLASYDKPTAVTFWHEPLGDMTPAEYVAASKQILPEFKRDKLRVGPLLNGWLLDAKEATLASFAPDALFDIWDWFGIDTYESGTMADPGEAKPADRIRAARRFLTSRGYDHALGIGEYNGFSAATIADAGEAILSTEDVWFGCLWNSDGDGKGYFLRDERLEAFRATLADPRAAQPRA